MIKNKCSLCIYEQTGGDGYVDWSLLRWYHFPKTDFEFNFFRPPILLFKTQFVAHLNGFQTLMRFIEIELDCNVNLYEWYH